MASQYFSAWRTCVKLAWQVPRATHTFLVDHLLSGDLTSVKTDALSRFIKFFRGLMDSPSMEVAVMCGVAGGDVQTTTGQNINLVRWESGLSNPLAVSARKLKEVLGSKLATVPVNDQWRLGYLGKLLEARGLAYYEGDDTERLTELIDSLCTS